MTWDFQDRNWQVGRREVDLPREVGHPRWEVAGREMGRGIYHSRWELAGRETGRGILPQEMGIVGTGRYGDGKRNLPQEMGHPRETNLPHDMTSKAGTGR